MRYELVRSRHRHPYSFTKTNIQKSSAVSMLKIRKMDLRIAAVVLEQDAILVTRNRHDFQ